MVPFSTVHFSSPIFVQPVRSLPLNSDTHCSSGSRLALFLGVCARNNAGSASSAINLRISTGSIIKSDAAPSGSRSLWASRCLTGESMFWIPTQCAADRPMGGINVLDLASRENVHHPLPGRPGFFAEIGETGEPGEPGEPGVLTS